MINFSFSGAARWLARTVWLAAGCALAAFALKIFFIPNRLIDGGTVGLAMIGSRLFGAQWLPPCPFKRFPVVAKGIRLFFQLLNRDYKEWDPNAIRDRGV